MRRRCKLADTGSFNLMKEGGNGAVERLRVAHLHGMPGAGYRLPSCVGKDVREFIGDDAENPGAPLSFKEENRNVHAGEQFIG